VKLNPPAASSRNPICLNAEGATRITDGWSRTLWDLGAFSCVPTGAHFSAGGSVLRVEISASRQPRRLLPQTRGGLARLPLDDVGGREQHSWTKAPLWRRGGSLDAGSGEQSVTVERVEHLARRLVGIATVGGEANVNTRQLSHGDRELAGMSDQPLLARP
jgi:hypothetical protein